MIPSEYFRRKKESFKGAKYDSYGSSEMLLSVPFYDNEIIPNQKEMDLNFGQKKWFES